MYLSSLVIRHGHDGAVSMHPMMHKLKARSVVQFLAQRVDVVTCVGVPAVLMSRLERSGPSGTMGFRREGRSVVLSSFSGVIWGFVALTTLLGMLREHMRSTLALWRARMRALKFAVFWAVFFLWWDSLKNSSSAATRFFTLSRGIGFWPTAIALSALFGWVHLGNAGKAGAAACPQD